MVRMTEAFQTPSFDGSNPISFKPFCPDKDNEAYARCLSARLRGEDARDILAVALKEEFAGRIALVSSFGAESAVLLHLVASVDRSTPVIFLDTGKHFAQTLAYRRKLARDLGLKDVRDIEPSPEALAEQDPDGKLYSVDTDACCHIRKVRPLNDALEGFDAWITGRKQFHSAGRAQLPVFEASARHIKVNPIVQWSHDDVAAYAARHELAAHPLVAQGYPSIGCWPCTRPADSAEDVRAGRWQGAEKTECGIHLPAGK